MASNAPVPSRKPDETRRFVFVESGINSNKEWIVDYWQAEGIMRARYGRIGDAHQQDVKFATVAEYTKKVAEKTRKGYSEVDTIEVKAPVGTTTVAGTTATAAVIRVVDHIFTAAGEAIKSFLSVKLDTMSSTHIAKARQKLREIANMVNNKITPGNALLARCVDEYYMLIPTVLPRKIDQLKLVTDFVQPTNIREQEDRLAQLEAAIATAMPTASGQVPHMVDQLGAKLVELDPTSAEYKKVSAMVTGTAAHGYTPQIREIFAVEIPGEREAYLRFVAANPKIKREKLFHGTRGKNVRHILRTGLQLPGTVGVANGSMFGAGIYWANRSTKSTNYCDHVSGSNPKTCPAFLFVGEVAVGREWVAPDADSSLKAAPAGYDSVYGKAGKTGSWGGKLQNDEKIVYRREQCTIQYLITFNR